MTALRSASPRALSAVALIALLAACGAPPPVRGPGTTAPRPGKAGRSAPVRTPARAPQRHDPPPPQVQSLPGVAGVIGASSAELVRQFGPPRLDVWEGDARKLQYAGTACVLDVYLYPPAAGREVQATYVDARRASDGQEVDRASCIAALRQSAGSAPAAGGVTRP